MRLSDDSHDYHCAECGTTGGVCLQGLALSQRIARGLAANSDRLPEGFELTSETLFTGCARECRVRLQVLGTTVALDCGTAGAAVLARLQAQTAQAVGA
jgi:hypothetical protein